MSAAPSAHRAGASTETALRRALLAIVAFACAGTLVELLLLEHFEDPWQYSPLVLLAAALVGSVAVAVRPTPATLTAFRALMLACIAAGALGPWLHYSGNAEFELEVFPKMAGWELFREAMTGATPVLAPGMMAVVGLLGLLYAWRHPGGRASRH